MRPILMSAAALMTLAACGQPETSTAQASKPAGTAQAASALSLGSDGLPRFRPGVWEVVTTDDGETETNRHCTGAEADAEIRALLTRETPDCKTTRSASSRGLKVDAVCSQAGGIKTESSLTMTGSETAYDMKLALYSILPSGERNGGVMTAKAKWTGPCPAGAKPGEDIEP